MPLRSTFVSMILAVFGTALSALPAVGAAGAPESDGSVPPQDLRALDWRLCPGDLEPGALGTADARATCIPVELEPWGRLGIVGEGGVYWYVTEVQAGNLRHPSLLLGKVAEAYELWIAGEQVGGVGSLPPESLSDYDRHLQVPLPDRTRDGDRVLVGLRVWASEEMGGFGGGPFEGEFLLGESDRLARRAVLHDLPRSILVVLFLFAGVYHLMLRIRGMGERSFLWFGLLAFDFAVYTFLRTQWKYALPFSFITLKEAEFAAMYLGPVIGLEFFWSLVGRPIARWLRVYQVGLAALALMVVLEPGLRWNLVTLDAFYVSLVPFSVATLTLLTGEAARGRAEARDLLVASVLLFATVFSDVLLTKGILGLPRLAPVGFGLLLLGMAIALTSKVGRLQRESENLKAELEARVRERTRELETLQEIVQAINRRFELEDVMIAVLEQGRRLVPQADRGVFLFRDPARDVFEVVATTGWAEGGVELVLPTTVALRRYRDEAAEIAPGITLVDRPESGPGFEHVAHLAGPRSLLCFRIDVADEVVGFVVFDDLSERDAFRRIDVLTLVHYREQVLTAVAKALSFRELVAKRQEAEQANRAKTDFLTTVSHELRSPLNSIIGFSGVLLDRLPPSDDSRHHRFLENIQSSGRHLLTLINEILDLSKIEAGRVEPRFESVDPAEAVRGVVGVASGVAAQRGIVVDVELEPYLPLVRADVGMLRQILWNLLSNAIKFSADGERVEVRASTSPTGSAVVFEVRDRGIGIPPEDHERIFRPFEQVDSSVARRYGGTGLGLALVRQMLELHRGTIELESEPDHGSVFRVRLPAAGVADPALGAI